MPPVPPTSDDPPHDIEFRTLDDDAWYTARTLLTNNSTTLVVKFLHFDDNEDVVFEADGFKNVEEVDTIQKRFRPLSKQLQDKECRRLSQGDLLCVSHSFRSSDFRFYDAFLDDVVRGEHRSDKVEEECTCEFFIVWKHGPCSGDLAKKRVEDICVVQPDPQLDPNAATFFMNVRKRLLDTSSMPSRISNDGGSVCDPVTPQKSNFSSSDRDNLTFLQRSDHRTKLKRPPTMQSIEEKISDHLRRKKSKEDIDMGGDKRCYLIMIENLDKNLSSSTIVEFIRKETSIAVEACIFPSSSWMLYNEGLISVDCLRNLDKVCRILESPDSVVVSKGGRPCVVTGKLSQYDLAANPILASMLKYQESSLHRALNIDNGLKVVYSGAEEYKTAVKLKDLFLEFVKHQKRLQKGLAMEESRILQKSQVP